jgi:16S rRNA (cytosine1402-N4)-methyltransferase
MHTPVLLNEVIKILDPKPGEFFIDGTFGAGGHSRAILGKLGPKGKLVAIEWDKTSAEKFMIHDSRFMIQIDNYANLPEILKRKKLPKVDGFLLDLGLSSEQLEQSGRGFSFEKDEPLLMTYSDEMKPVREILKELTKEELAKIIFELSQEKYSRQIAKAIKEKEKFAPIETSWELAYVIKSAVPKNYEKGRIHPATRTFMALRIYANKELENLEKILKNLDRILKINGRTAIISFHSLEDRLVKNYFRQMAKTGKAKLLTKKPIIPTKEEIIKNPRARSAKLRAIIML